MNRKIALASTGSIAVLNIPHLVIMLRKAMSCKVAPILSEGAIKFITPLAIECIAEEQPIAGRVDDYSDKQIENHLSTCQVFVLAPATANSIAKLANGISDSLPTRAASLFKGPIIIAPAMNEMMWNKNATIRNINSLSNMGFHLVGPSPGLEIATYQSSQTSMATIDEIFEKIISVAPMSF